MALSVSGAHRVRTLDDTDPGGGSAPPAPVPIPLRGADAHVDRGIADAVRNAGPSDHPQGDGILYLGMNEGSAALEVSALQTATHGQVTAIVGHRGSSLETKFGTFDFKNDADVRSFASKLVAHYGLPTEKAAEIERLLMKTDPAPSSADGTFIHGGGRDELARIALYMARAESGRGDMPSRLVLSGHHSSSGQLYGDRSGGFDLRDVAALGKLFPGAAKQVEDIHFSGCVTSSDLRMNRKEWVEAFPQLATMWGYHGFSDLAPVNDLRAWEVGSRGRTDAIDAKAIAGHGDVTVWSEKLGVVDTTGSLTRDLADAKDADTRFAGFVSGRVAVPHATDARAHDDYMAYARMGAHGDASAKAKAEVLFRVRFYEQRVRGQFASAHGAEMSRGFQALGLPAPDFSKLTRQEAMAEVASFQRAAFAHPRIDVSSAAKLVVGLANLDPALIPSDWCRG